MQFLKKGISQHSRASLSVRSVLAPFATVSTRRAFSQAFLQGSNANYIDAMYDSWRADPQSVHPSWDAYFKTGNFDAPPSLGGQASPAPNSSGGVSSSELQKQVRDAVNIQNLIRNYQVRGHFVAELDPLNLLRRGADKFKLLPPELELLSYGFSEADLAREFDIGGVPEFKGFLGTEMQRATLGDFYQRLRDVYCKNVGYEYMHIPDTHECNWLRERIETKEPHQFSKAERLMILDRLTWADHFEKFLSVKYVAQKRFGLDGSESLIPGMKAIIDQAGEFGIDDIVMGMPHRGRLNVLSTVVRKPLEKIFREFRGEIDEEQVLGSGDVKYHLGTSFDRPTHSGQNIHLSLVANPSHLEAVDAVVVGKTRAKMTYKGDEAGDRTMAILLHGDAAFAGQGIIQETMNLGELPGYQTGGTIHMVVNNQIGFTTDPYNARSSAYCTDIARAVNAPIFHVNGDKPEEVVRVCKLAMEYRQQFKKDVVIDLVCYRRYGHNEADEPKFTQPKMYSAVDKQVPVLKQYQDKLVADGVATQEEIDAVSNRVQSKLVQSFEDSKKGREDELDWLDDNWEAFKGPRDPSKMRETGVDTEALRETVGPCLSQVPSDFQVHRRIGKIFKDKAKMFESGQNFDWGTAEAMAFGSLMQEGHHVRLSGQDVERGTFSHRHAVVHNQDPEGVPTYTPLDHLDTATSSMQVYNSSLSEYGVLGFEYGYSLENPNALVIWEAQFGDFFNGAQIVIDQFISSGEDKWLRQSGLTLLLPHGFEGQGPEHSSGRMERFLQMSADDPHTIPVLDETTTQIQQTNWQVVNLSTPANYFHVLRRQCHRQFRKPLVVFSPKSLLKFKKCVSELADFETGTRFKQIIPERHPEQVNPDASKIQKLIFCSGRVYYDVAEHRQQAARDDVAVVTIEQISPFPFQLVQEQARLYPNAEIVWCQEEPKNMGAWTYVEPRFETALKQVNGARPRYAGRDTNASPATGRGSKVHNAEVQALLEQAFQQ